jgi:gluconolactonase
MARNERKAEAMKKIVLLVCLFTAPLGTLRATEEYPLGPDSQRQAGVPQGAVTHYTWTSRIFPGTTRDYWVYVPAEYNPDKPACVMVFQDGEMFIKEDGRARVPIVFDNLIAKRQMPVTIGIFINPGVLKALSPDQQNRYNRSFEYDSLGDRYARFLLQEILPEVAKHYNLSTNPDDRAVGGLSSGGICAFNVAWTHPEAFHRVLSFIGSFTDLRGGDIFPALIRKTEPKPLRIFMQDGNHDLNLYAGSWWLANQSVASALEWAGYDVRFVTGDKDHDMIQGGAILPDALRWLWRDYPQPITKPAPNHSGDTINAILDPASDWEEAPRGDLGRMSYGTAVTRTGGKYLLDRQRHTVVYRAPTGKERKVIMDGISRPGGIALSPDDSLLLVDDATEKWVWSFQIQANGSLANGEPFYRLETRDESSRTAAAGMAVDTLGYLYVATNLGIQVCDQPGRVVAIINSPAPGPLLGVTFGGADFQYLYVDVRDKIYRRHLLRKGVPPGTIVEPPVPHL